MRTTLKDIAREVGVSVTAVSRALNGYSDVSLATRQKVLEVARRLNYYPNSIARGLVTQKTGMIGLFSVGHALTYSLMSDPFAAEVIDAILERCGETGYDLLLFSRNRINGADSYVSLAVQRQIDAAIFLGLRTDDRRYQELKSLSIPVVTVDVPLDYERSVCVGCDQVQGAMTATRYLIEMGHRRIAMINGHLHAPVSHERFLGFKSVLDAAGIELKPEWIRVGDFSRQSGTKCMHELLQLEQKPTAVFCVSDLMALGAMDALRSEGYVIPRDLSVIGFDNIRASADAYPPLTTVHQPRYLLGTTVADAAIEAIGAGPDWRGAPRIYVDSELIVRDSVARLAVRSM